MILRMIIILMLSIWDFYNMSKENLKKEKMILIFLSLLSLIMSYLYSKYPYDISIAGFALDLFGYPH